MGRKGWAARAAAFLSSSLRTRRRPPKYGPQSARLGYATRSSHTLHAYPTLCRDPRPLPVSEPHSHPALRCPYELCAMHTADKRLGILLTAHTIATNTATAIRHRGTAHSTKLACPRLGRRPCAVALHGLQCPSYRRATLIWQRLSALILRPRSPDNVHAGVRIKQAVYASCHFRVIWRGSHEPG